MMRNFRATMFALLAALATFTGADAQQRTSTDERLGVDVIHSGEDRVGVMFAAAVRDALAGSPRYKLDGTSALEMRLVTIDGSVGDDGLSTAVAVVFTVYRAEDWPAYLQQQVLVVGRNRVESMARELLAALDGVLNDLAEGSR